MTNLTELEYVRGLGAVEGVTEGVSQLTEVLLSSPPRSSEMTREPFSGTAHAVKKK